MDKIADIPTIAHVIQQAVAPVFLLTGIGSILAVLTSRLGRTVDRFRNLSEANDNQAKTSQAEMRTLSARARWTHAAITLCTVSALCICLSVAAMFVGAELTVDLSSIVAMLFIAAMLTLIAGLLCFLREIWLATGVIEMSKK